MKKWILKAIVQKTISYVPFKHRVNYVFQKYVTKGVYLTDEYFYDRLGHAKTHLNAYDKHSGGTPKTTLEIGTGWYPITPILFFLAGVENIISVDISFLTSKERIKTTLTKFLEAEKKGLLDPYIKECPERWGALKRLSASMDSMTLDDILSALRLTYKIEDARQLSLPDDSVDLVNSNNTFEHIYPGLLIPILKEFKRVVHKNHGIQSHFIDMSDHFAHFDKSINIYNFLQFSPSQWKRIDNSIQPQSRLRVDDYREIYDDLGIPITEAFFRTGDLDMLRSVKLHEEFSAKPLEMVAVSHCHFISKMSQCVPS